MKYHISILLMVIGTSGCIFKRSPSGDPADTGGPDTGQPTMDGGETVGDAVDSSGDTEEPIDTSGDTAEAVDSSGDTEDAVDTPD
ncbi:MAG: hypothetical protein ABEN55_11515, partial [Bradymonadaceae bacterium]